MSGNWIQDCKKILDQIKELDDLKEQDRSARKKHKKIAKGSSKKTCIECHKGVAHEVPEEPEE